MNTPKKYAYIFEAENLFSNLHNQYRNAKSKIRLWALLSYTDHFETDCLKTNGS